MTRQPWLGGPAFDLILIIGPAVLTSSLVLACPWFFETHAVSPIYWALLVIGVDVTHVYATLYRTYFDAVEFRRHRPLFLIVPLLGFLAFAALYSLGAMVFWRVLAYLAVFHFIRQQYGFAMMYRRGEPSGHWIGKAAIYAATIYPLIWWHIHPRHFSWLIEGDFLQADAAALGAIAFMAYALIMVAYAGMELWRWRKARSFNLPANLLLLSTALSWWVGIINLNSDLSFTMINVLSHGIPYLALIWLYQHRVQRRGEARPVLGLISAPKFYSVALIPAFLLIPILLSWIEEGLWDGFVWREHASLFGPFAALPAIDDGMILTWLVPLLALPQITHYLLDAFIWRRAYGDGLWRATLFAR